MKKIGQLKILSSSEINDSRVSIGFEGLDRDLFDPERCYDLLAATGVKHARIQTGWAKCEKEKGVYDFSWLDSTVDDLLRRGIKPWFNVTYGNPLYMPDAPNSTAVGCVPLYYGEEAVDAWLSYVTALTEHFKTRITHYEIWNEPDAENFWHPEKPNGDDYAKLVHITRKAIKKEYPEAVIGIGTALTEYGYLRRVFKGLTPGEFDFYCMHNYDRRLEFGIRQDAFRALPVLFNEYGHKNIEIWMGEGGHASWHPVGHWQCTAGGGSEYRQAVWMSRRFLLDLLYGTKITSFFQMVDMWQRPYEMAHTVETRHAAHGILNGITYAPKLSYFVLGRLATLLAGDVKLINKGITVSARKSNSEPALYSASYESDGREIHAYWFAYYIEEEKGLNAYCDVTLDGDSSIKDPVVIDVFTGDVYDPESENGRMTGLPIGDRPVFITDRSSFEII